MNERTSADFVMNERTSADFVMNEWLVLTQ